MSTGCLQVLAKAITKGSNNPVNDYLKMTNKKKVVIRDINPKSISTQELYGFVNMATREWKVCCSGDAPCEGSNALSLHTMLLSNVTGSCACFPSGIEVNAGRVPVLRQ